MALHRPILQQEPTSLLQTSPVLEIDHGFSSNAHVAGPHGLGFKHDAEDMYNPHRSSPTVSPNRCESQSQSVNQNPTRRYRTSYNLKLRPPPRQIPLRYNSEIASPPPFFSNAGHSTLRGFSSPYAVDWTLVSPISAFKHHRKHSVYDSQLFWLGLYFVLNLSLTLFNKGVLLQFPFPYTLTALHALCGSIGGYMLLANGFFVPARLGSRETAALVTFSVLYAVNIVVSNLSLQLVTVPFHQVVRAATPIFTIALSGFFFGTMSSPAKTMSLIPVIIGVALATYGDYYFTMWGLVLTLLGTFLAALKTIFTSVLQSRPSLSSLSTRSMSAQSSFLPPRLHMHPLDLLTRMAPLAFIQCVFYAHLTGELDRVRHFCAHEMTGAKAGALGVNGALAFALNVVSFSANGRVGPVTMSVAGNMKQVLTILFAVLIFDLTITRMNALGIVVTLVGGAWYAVVEYQEKRGRWRRR